jgi:hypothetical protein
LECRRDGAPAVGLGSVRLCTLCGVEILGNVGNAALEWDFALRGICGDDVGFCAYDVEDGVVSQVRLELLEPAAHFVERLGICDVIA